MLIKIRYPNIVNEFENTEGKTLVTDSTLAPSTLSKLMKRTFRGTFIVRWRGCERHGRLALHWVC